MKVGAYVVRNFVGRSTSSGAVDSRKTRVCELEIDGIKLTFTVAVRALRAYRSAHASRRAALCDVAPLRRRA